MTCVLGNKKEKKMNDSILNTIKGLLEIESTDTSFDSDLVRHINSAIFKSGMIGVGDDQKFKIENEEAKWKELTTREDLEGLIDFIYIDVKLVFDPPQTGPLLNNLKEERSRLEFHLLVQAEEGGEQ